MKRNVADEFLAYTLGEADAETERRFEEEMDDPASEVSTFIEAVRKKGLGLTLSPEERALFPRDDSFDEDEEEGSDESESPTTRLPAVPSSVRTAPIDPRVLRVVYGATAACLFFMLGYATARRAPQAGPELSVATASPVFTPLRGAGFDVSIEFRSDRDGFVAVAALFPGQRPQVLPVFGGDPIAVGPGKSPKVGPLPPGATQAVFVLTDRPASEAVIEALRGQIFTPERPGEIMAFLRSTLKNKGYRALASGSLPVNIPSPTQPPQ